MKSSANAASIFDAEILKTGGVGTGDMTYSEAVFKDRPTVIALEGKGSLGLSLAKDGLVLMRVPPMELSKILPMLNGAA